MWREGQRRGKIGWPKGGEDRKFVRSFELWKRNGSGFQHKKKMSYHSKRIEATKTGVSWVQGH